LAADAGILPVRKSGRSCLRPESEAFDTTQATDCAPYDSKEFPEIPQQDYANLPLQQLACMRGFDFHAVVKQRRRHDQNYQRLIDGYLAVVTPNCW